MRCRLLAAAALLALIVSPAFADRDTGYNNLGTNQVSVGSSATLIITNRARNAVTIFNPTSGQTVYIGGSAVTTSNGFVLAPGYALTLQTNAAVYGVVSSSTQAVSEVETY